MDTLAFFRLLVPDTGIHFITEWVPKPDHPRGGVMPHHPVGDLSDMVEKAMELDAAGHNTYFAMASYKEVIYKTTKSGYEFPAGREQANALHVKCLWQDFDVGKKDISKAYESRDDALAALKLYLKETGLPVPLIVSSGNGIHTYWPFTEHVTAAEWNQIAQLQRVIFDKLGVKYDSSRDKDCASVLRPIGTHNYGKGGAKPVRVIRGEVTPQPASYYRDTLTAYIEKNNLALPLSKRRNSPFAITHDLEAYDYPPSYIAIIAEHCAQIAKFRDTGGDSEPDWYYPLGLAKHCEDGHKYAHEWSAKHEGYDPANTDAKMEQWTYGPTTCEEFAKKCGAKTCEGCAHAGRIVSPISLGRSVEDSTKEAPPDVPPAPVAEASEEMEWPVGYRAKNGCMEIAVEVDGVVSWTRFANTIFFPTEWHRLEDGTKALRFKHEIRPGIYEFFDIPTKLLVDKRTMKTSLGAFAVILTNDAFAVRFIMDFLHTLKQRRDMKPTHTQLGWIDNDTSFLIGDTAIGESANKKVILSGAHIKEETLHHCFKVTGSKEAWKQGVKELYGRAGMEPYQYVFATVFGSVVSPLLGFKDWTGIPLAFTSDKSGYGKSTAAKIAVNALCDAQSIMISNATPLSVINRASQHGNLILYADEAIATNMTGTEMGQIFYALSNGKPRIGSGSDGKERNTNPPFNLLSILTGNRCVVSSITESKVNPEAQQMRVLEIDLVDIYGGVPPFDESTVPLALDLVNNHTGLFAEDFVRYVIKNKAKIRAEMQEFAVKILGKMKGTAHKERFYAYHVACSIYGLKLACELGMVEFDWRALFRWAMDHIKRIRRTVEEQHMTAEDKLSAMLSDMHGSLLITKEYDALDVRRGVTELPIMPVRGTACGRLALGTNRERGRLYVSARAIDEWCRKEKLNPHQFKRELTTTGLIRDISGKHPDKKVSLGRGIPTVPVGQTRVIEIDFDAAQGYIKEFVTEGNVVPIQVAKSVTNPVAVEKETAPEGAVSG